MTDILQGQPARPAVWTSAGRNDVRIGAKVARQCACRGWIVAAENPVGSVAEQVTQHQSAEPHKSWDRDTWIALNTTTQPVRTILRRVDK